MYFSKKMLEYLILTKCEQKAKIELTVIFTYNKIFRGTIEGLCSQRMADGHGDGVETKRKRIG